MPDEKKRKVRVVVGRESSRRVDCSGAASDVGMPLNDQFPPDPPIVREAVVSEGARRRVQNDGTEADDESEFISVGGPLSVVGGCESEDVTFEEAVVRAVRISERDCVGYGWTTDLLVFKLLNNH